jgi:hypothetical protein
MMQKLKEAWYSSERNLMINAMKQIEWLINEPFLINNLVSKWGDYVMNNPMI